MERLYWGLPICVWLAAPLLLLGVANLPVFGQTMALGEEYEIWQDICVSNGKYV